MLSRRVGSKENFQQSLIDRQLNHTFGADLADYLVFATFTGRF